MTSMNVYWQISLYLILPIFLLFIAERVFLYLLSSHPNGKKWVQSQFWLHPNFISRCRYPMGIVSVGLFHYGWQIFAIIWFSGWLLTDITDGEIARRFDLNTPEGEVIDPLSDKLLYFPPLIYYWYLGAFPLVLIITFLVFDIAGQLSRFFIAKKTANLFGKAKTFLSITALFIATLEIVFFPEMHWQIPIAILSAAVFLSFCSLFFKVIPNYWYANILSLLNLCCGIIGILLIIFEYPPIFAFLLVFLGQFLDMFDGRAAARWGSTPRGEILDDLADGTNFGGTVGVIIYASFNFSLLGLVLGIIHFICTSYRLIRFISDKKKAGVTGGVSVFVGLPSPAAALVSATGVILFQDMTLLKIGLVLIPSFLMISKVPYIHFGREILPKIPKILKVILLALILIALMVSYILQNHEVILYVIFASVIVYLVFGFMSLFLRNAEVSE